jgi:hypothetical protein
MMFDVATVTTAAHHRGTPHALPEDHPLGPNGGPGGGGGVRALPDPGRAGDSRAIASSQVMAIGLVGVTVAGTGLYVVGALAGVLWL